MRNSQSLIKSFKSATCTWCWRVLIYPWMFLVPLPSQLFLPPNPITLLYLPLLISLTQTLHTFSASHNRPSVSPSPLPMRPAFLSWPQLRWTLSTSSFWTYLLLPDCAPRESMVTMPILFCFLFTCVCVVLVHVCMCLRWGGHICVGVCIWKPKADNQESSWMALYLIHWGRPLSWT